MRSYPQKYHTFGFHFNINRQRGLSDRSSVSTPTLNRSHSYALASKLAQSTDSAIRDQVPGRQTGSGGNIFPTTVTWVLQPHLLGAQKGWRLQTGVQFEAPNRYVAREKLKMETQRDITTALHAGDWAVCIDLTDAYSHVPIHLLRFAFRWRTESGCFSSELCHSSSLRHPGFLPG